MARRKNRWVWTKPHPKFVEMREKFAEYREGSLSGSNPSPVKRSTGVPMIDQIAGGGIGEPSVNAVVGPYGFDSSYITTLLVEGQILRDDAHLVHQSGPCRCIVVTSRDDLTGLHERLLKSLCCKPTDYGAKPLAASRGAVTLPIASQRTAQLTEVIASRVLYTSNLGENFFCLLSSLEERSRDFGVSAIIIDNITAIQSQYREHWAAISTLLGVPEYDTFLIQAFLEIICRKLAQMYQCPVWVIHFQKKVPTPKRPVIHANFRRIAWCTPFVDYTDTCLMIGNETPGSGLYSITCCKSPYNKANSRSSLQNAQIVVQNNYDKFTIEAAKDVTIDSKSKGWKSKKSVDSDSLRKQMWSDAEQLCRDDCFFHEIDERDLQDFLEVDEIE